MQAKLENLGKCSCWGGRMRGFNLWTHITLFIIYCSLFWMIGLCQFDVANMNEVTLPPYSNPPSCYSWCSLLLFLSTCWIILREKGHPVLRVSVGWVPLPAGTCHVQKAGLKGCTQPWQLLIRCFTKNSWGWAGQQGVWVPCIPAGSELFTQGLGLPLGLGLNKLCWCQILGHVRTALCKWIHSKKNHNSWQTPTC